MRLVCAAFCALTLLAHAATAQVYVRPYFRADGTFVEGHYRTLPNGIASDNLSHRDRARQAVPQAAPERRAQPRTEPPGRPAARQPKS